MADNQHLRRRQVEAAVDTACYYTIRLNQYHRIEDTAGDIDSDIDWAAVEAADNHHLERDSTAVAEDTQAAAEDIQVVVDNRVAVDTARLDY